MIYPGYPIRRAKAVIAVAETNGFELIRNKKQLVNFLGFYVIVKDSGTSVKGKPRISKRGNRHLRKAMHMPALTAIRHETSLCKAFLLTFVATIISWLLFGRLASIVTPISVMTDLPV